MFGAMLEGTKRISTPFYLFSPDDIIAKREVNLKDIITGMSKVLEIKRLQFLDYEIHQTDWHKTLVQSKTDEFPYVKTSCWSGNTHIGYTFHYNYIYGTKQEELKQYPLELVMHDEYQKLIERNGFDHAYSIYGCCIYGTIGDSAVVEHDFSYANKEKTVRYHSYDFPDGTKAVGSLSTELLNTQFEWLGDIDFKDKSVIDIGCWDGFYSIKAKQKGARSVLGIDINPWGKSDWIANFREAVKKFGFNPVDIDCRYEDLFELDCYWEKRDIVLFMGVLYHLQEPLSALYRLRNLTREKLVIETLIDGDDLPFPALKFYPGKEMGNDPTNWFGPNKLWIESALKVVGFDDVKLIHEHGNRAVYHAS